jgi:hypothetical protein
MNTAHTNDVTPLSAEEEARLFDQLSTLVPASIDAKYATRVRVLTESHVACAARARTRRRYVMGSASALIASMAAGTGVVQVAQRRRENVARVYTDANGPIGYWVVNNLPAGFTPEEVSDPSFAEQRNDYRTFGALFSDGKTSFTVMVAPKGQPISLPAYDPLQPPTLAVWDADTIASVRTAPGSALSSAPPFGEVCITSGSSEENSCVLAFDRATVVIGRSHTMSENNSGITFDEGSRSIQLDHLPTGFSYVGPYNVADAYAVDYLNTLSDSQEIELQVGRLAEPERLRIAEPPKGDQAHVVQRGSRTYRITNVSHRIATPANLHLFDGPIPTDTPNLDRDAPTAPDKALTVDLSGDGFDRIVASWRDDNGLWFSLSGTVSEDEIVRLAESVAKATPEQEAMLLTKRKPSPSSSNTPLAQLPIPVG